MALFFKKTLTAFKFSRMPNRDSLYFRLAKHSDFDNLRHLRSNILDYVNK